MKSPAISHIHHSLGSDPEEVEKKDLARASFLQLLWSDLPAGDHFQDTVAVDPPAQLAKTAPSVHGRPPISSPAKLNECDEPGGSYRAHTSRQGQQLTANMNVAGG